MKYVLNKALVSLFLSCLFFSTLASGSELTAEPQRSRPFIWVTEGERADILHKIETEQWAKQLYSELKLRADEAVSRHARDRIGFLNGLPLEWHEGPDAYPRFHYILKDGGKQPGQAHRTALMSYLQESIDCGVLYYLTGDDRYAQVASDVLAVVVEALSRMERGSQGNNAGLVYPDDHLKEARVFGAQIPLIYDFVYSHLANGAHVLDVVSGSEVAFPFEKAQAVFRTYVDMALEEGIVDCNWPVLEATSLLHNILALDDPAQRAELLPFVTEVDVPRQDSIKKVAASFQNPGDMWPESLGYSTHVSQFCVYLMTVIDRLHPELGLGGKYPNVSLSLAGAYNLEFPNGEVPGFGDGHRHYEEPYLAIEFAHLLATLNGLDEQAEIFGSLIKTGLRNGNYERGKLEERSMGASPYKTPLQLLWQQSGLKGAETDYPHYRTEVLPFAGLHLQRNVPEQNAVENGLMAWVGAGSFVHGHASGMNIELYGKGFVLGPTGGKSTYRTDIHENYYRLFAAHNTVVSNGASASKGDWVNLGINRLELVSMEPMPRKEAVSKNYSFSTTRFYDEHNLVAPAWHERTLAVIRTSESSGYYVDVFRAKSDVENQFHDYIYRNIGETLEFSGVTLGDDDGRFAGPAEMPWKSNQLYRHPGWHFFKNVKVSGVLDTPVKAVFEASKLAANTVGMTVFLNGTSNRSYASAMSPPATLNTSDYYKKKDIPTLVVRKEGEAWNQPFAAIYEPFSKKASNGSVQSVETLEEAGVFKGFVVKSTIAGQRLTQLVLIQESGQVYENADWKLRFVGHFAVVTIDAKGSTRALYIGDGASLVVGDEELTPAAESKSAFVSF